MATRYNSRYMKPAMMMRPLHLKAWDPMSGYVWMSELESMHLCKRSPVYKQMTAMVMQTIEIV
jgi:hypothetical protein